MHEEYGWDGKDEFGYAYQQMVTILGSKAILSKIMELNDCEGKSFSEIADWLKKNLFDRLDLNDDDGLRTNTQNEK